MLPRSALAKTRLGLGRLPVVRAVLPRQIASLSLAARSSDRADLGTFRGITVKVVRLTFQLWRGHLWSPDGTLHLLLPRSKTTTTSLRPRSLNLPEHLPLRHLPLPEAIAQRPRHPSVQNQNFSPMRLNPVSPVVRPLKDLNPMYLPNRPLRQSS